MNISERRACRVIDHNRSTQRYILKPNEFNEKLTERVIKLASRYGRYGYRTITDLLNNEGWRINKKRVERIWRLEGLKVPYTDYGQSTRIMCGVMTLYLRELMMGEVLRC